MNRLEPLTPPRVFTIAWVIENSPERQAPEGWANVFGSKSLEAHSLAEATDHARAWAERCYGPIREGDTFRIRTTSHDPPTALDDDLDARPEASV